MCGKEVRDFQSKDGPCDLRTLMPKDVDTFYATCDCGNHIQYKTRVVRILRGLRMTRGRVEKRAIGARNEP